MPKRAPESHRIGREGRLLFQELLPKDWVPRLEDGIDDYGIDVTVEILDGERLTGLRCLAQLRSTEHPDLKVRSNSVGIQVGVDEIEYWESKQLATFLVVIDLANRQLYWIEMHQWIRKYTEEHGDDWRKQGSVVVSIPRTNNAAKVPTDWVEISRVEPAKIAVGHLGLLPYREYREAAQIARDNPEQIRAKQAQVRALESGLHVDQALALQAEGRFEESRKSIQDAWSSATASGDHERIVVAAKLVLAGGNPLDESQNSMMFEVAKQGMQAAQAAGLKQEESYLVGMAGIVASHRFVTRINHAKLQQKIVASSPAMTKWFADEGVRSMAQALMVATGEVFDSIDELQEAGSYWMMADLLRHMAITEGMIADFGQLLEGTDPTPLHQLSMRHHKVAFAVAKALENDDLMVQGLLDMAMQASRMQDNKTVDYSLAEAADLIGRMQGGKAHEGRLARITDMIRNPPPKRPKRDYDDLSEDEKDDFMRTFARQGGIDIDSPKNDVDEIIAVGIKDRNPERVLRWCEHLEVATTSYGVPAELMGLPTAGSKVLYCGAKPYALESFRLDDLLKGYQEGPCIGCPMRKPRPADWKWTEKWARERGISDKFKGFLEARSGTLNPRPKTDVDPSE